MKNSFEKYNKYKYRAYDYANEVLNIKAWSSGSIKFDQVGQKELLDTYSETLEKLHIRANIEESIAKGDGNYTQADIPIVKNWIRVEAGHGVGKCLGYDENIILADGSVVKAQNLIGKTVLLPDIEGQNEAYFFDNGTKYVAHIRFNNGVVITRTLNHPLWTNDKWVNSGDIRKGDKFNFVSYTCNHNCTRLHYEYASYQQALDKWYELWAWGYEYKIIKNTDNYSLVFSDIDHLEVVDIKYGVQFTVGVTVPSTNTFTTFIYEHNTNIASIIVSHFFDCFVPSITTCYAPTYVQVNDLLFKEIRKWRTKNGLQGNILKKPKLQPPIEYELGDWIAEGKAVGDSTESIQGQHDGYLLFILDEAEGLPQYLYDAVLSMASGGKCIIILLANPKTTNSPFHELKSKSYVNNFRISCLNHPNVTSGYEQIKGAVTRNYVRSMIFDHCKPYHEMDESRYTFQVDWLDGIWLPDNEFLFRVMGIAPNNLNYNSFFNVAQVEQQVIKDNTNNPDMSLFYQLNKFNDNEVLQIGIDVARQGNDYATIYTSYAGIVRCQYRLQYSELIDFKLNILELLENFNNVPIEYVSIRIDATGNGWGVVDYLNMIDFQSFGYEVYIHPIQNNEVSRDKFLFADKVTEMYYLASQELNNCMIVEFDNLNQLQFELTNRLYDYITRGEREVKKLESKKIYKGRHKNSPDDADGFVLAIVPDDYFDLKPDYGIA